ncbi:OmpA/MotB family protein [Sanguibacter massiliensis]|uniref:OmpA/MotB family protein n=1 Tax=Sanguibacter massiliensis TaxID=1973217 RepID=UPI000C81851D|nr:flagellar motor protein MotB [Sanguibacter massiliensis]
MSARRRRREEPEEHVNHERWLVSYSDMMTVLMALFLVMYAISQVDADKFEALRASLSRGFGHTGDVVLVGGTGVMDATSDLVGVPDVGSTLTGLGDQVGDGDHTAQEYAAAQSEFANLSSLRDEVADALGEKGHDGAVEFRVTQAGLVIGMVTTDVFFDPGSDAIGGEFREVVDAIGGPLGTSSYEMKIEGHADTVPVGSRFETNWDLSAARATAVLRRLVEHRGVAPDRISAVGYGEARPLVDGTDAAALAANRRVDIVVLSSQPERVRELLPTIQNAAEGA